MISSILSRIFRLCFFLTVAAGLIAITAQLIQRPVHMPAGYGDYINLGEPGLRIIPMQTTTSLQNGTNDTGVDPPVAGSLRVLPSTAMQQAGFIMYLVIQFGCFALLFICLSRLFRHFSKKAFFTRENVMLVKRTGWLLLLPCVATVLLYWPFLVSIHPLKLAMDSAGGALASVEMTARIDWTLVILGAGLLVLGHIFTGGLELKEENDSFV